MYATLLCVATAPFPGYRFQQNLHKRHLFSVHPVPGYSEIKRVWKLWSSSEHVEDDSLDSVLILCQLEEFCLRTETWCEKTTWSKARPGMNLQVNTGVLLKCVEVVFHLLRWNLSRKQTCTRATCWLRLNWMEEFYWRHLCLLCSFLPKLLLW